MTGPDTTPFEVTFSEPPETASPGQLALTFLDRSAANAPLAALFPLPLGRRCRRRRSRCTTANVPKT